MDLKKIGNFGEKIACFYLEKKGYKVLERNYIKKLAPPGKGEIDIIAQKGDIISFVEVKTIQQDFSRPKKRQNFLPEDKVDFRKQRKLKNLAQIWLSENKKFLDSKWQIDVIAVRVDLNIKKAKINHFQNAV